ncbi:MAG: hypothetical protein ACRD0W_21535 [Acidimicrobiales bacterium]
MSTRMYHPGLEPPDNETEAMDDAQAAVLAESGWLPAPEPDKVEGYEPEPVKYEPVVSKAKRATKSTAKSTD